MYFEFPHPVGETVLFYSKQEIEIYMKNLPPCTQMQERGAWNLGDCRDVIAAILWM